MCLLAYSKKKDRVVYYNLLKVLYISYVKTPLTNELSDIIHEQDMTNV